MTKWSKNDERGLLTAWRDAQRLTGDPRPLRARTHALYAARSNGPVRLLDAVWYKLRSMENMARVIIAFEACVGGRVDSDERQGGRAAARWFALDDREKHQWFARLNTRSYTYRALTPTAFRFLKDTMDADEDDDGGKPEDDAVASTGRRVRLRRNSEAGEWRVDGGDTQEQLPPDSNFVGGTVIISDVRSTEMEPTTDANVPESNESNDAAEVATHSLEEEQVEEAPDEPMLGDELTVGDEPMGSDGLMVGDEPTVGDEYDGSSTESDSELGEFDDNFEAASTGDDASLQREISQLIDSEAASSATDEAEQKRKQKLPDEVDPPSDAIGSHAAGGDRDDQFTNAVTVAPPTSPPSDENQRVPLNELLSIVSIVETQANHLKHMVAQVQRDKVAEQKVQRRNDNKLTDFALAVHRLTRQFQESLAKQRRKNHARVLAETHLLRELQLVMAENRRGVKKVAKETRAALEAMQSQHDRELKDLRAEVVSLRAQLEAREEKVGAHTEAETQQPGVNSSHIKSKPLASERKRTPAAPEPAATSARPSSQERQRDWSSYVGSTKMADMATSDSITPRSNDSPLALVSYVKAMNKKAKRLAVAGAKIRAVLPPEDSEAGSTTAVLLPTLNVAASVAQASTSRRAEEQRDRALAEALVIQSGRAKKPVRVAAKQPTPVRKEKKTKMQEKAVAAAVATATTVAAEADVAHDESEGKATRPAKEKASATTTAAVTTVSAASDTRGTAARKPKGMTQPMESQVKEVAEKKSSNVKRSSPPRNSLKDFVPFVVQTTEPKPSPTQPSASRAVATSASSGRPPNSNPSLDETESATKTLSSTGAEKVVKRSAKTPPSSTANLAASTAEEPPTRKRKRSAKEEQSQPAAGKAVVSREVSSKTVASARQQQQKLPSAANRAEAREDPKLPANARQQSNSVRIFAAVDKNDDEVKENKATNTRDNARTVELSVLKTAATLKTAAEKSAPTLAPLLTELQPAYRTRANRARSNKRTRVR